MAFGVVFWPGWGNCGLQMLFMEDSRTVGRGSITDAAVIAIADDFTVGCTDFAIYRLMNNRFDLRDHGSLLKGDGIHVVGIKQYVAQIEGNTIKQNAASGTNLNGIFAYAWGGPQPDGTFIPLAPAQTEGFAAVQLKNNDLTMEGGPANAKAYGFYNCIKGSDCSGAVFSLFAFMEDNIASGHKRAIESLTWGSARTQLTALTTTIKDKPAMGKAVAISTSNQDTPDWVCVTAINNVLEPSAFTPAQWRFNAWSFGIVQHFPPTIADLDSFNTGFNFVGKEFANGMNPVGTVQGQLSPCQVETVDLVSFC